MALALATHLSMYPALLVLPVILINYDQHSRLSKAVPDWKSFSLKCTSFFAIAFALFALMSYTATGLSWEFLSSTYGNHILVTDLTPNIGLWWYFLIEMFDSFREFFLGVFWLHLSAYVGGLSIRIRRQPLFVTIAMLGVFAIFKPYPSISDAALFLSALPLYRHVFPCKSLSIVTLPLEHWLTPESNAIFILRGGSAVVRNSSWSRLLLFVDLRWIRKCQFLLCHHLGMEPGLVCCNGRCLVGGSSRRVGSRATRDERQGREAALSLA